MIWGYHYFWKHLDIAHPMGNPLTTPITKDIFLWSLGTGSSGFVPKVCWYNLWQTHIRRPRRPSYFSLYWLVNRDPYNGLLRSQHNWVVIHPLYLYTKQPIDSLTSQPSYPFIRPSPQHHPICTCGDFGPIYRGFLLVGSWFFFLPLPRVAPGAHLAERIIPNRREAGEASFGLCAPLGGSPPACFQSSVTKGQQGGGLGAKTFGIFWHFQIQKGWKCWMLGGRLFGKETTCRLFEHKSNRHFFMKKGFPAAKLEGGLQCWPTSFRLWESHDARDKSDNLLIRPTRW